MAITIAGFYITTTTTFSIFLLGFIGGICGILLIITAYYALGSREYAETFAAVRGRLWRRAQIEGATIVASAEEQGAI